MPSIACPECERNYAVGWTGPGSVVRCDCGSRFAVSLRPAYRLLALRVVLAAVGGAVGAVLGEFGFAAAEATRLGAPAWVAPVALAAAGLLIGAALPETKRLVQRAPQLPPPPGRRRLFRF